MPAGSTRKKCCPGEIACLDLGLHGAYVGGLWLEADRATARRRPRRNYPILVLAHGSRRTEGLLGIHRATSAAIDAFAGNVVWRGLNTYAEALVCNRLDQPLPTTESGDGSTLTRTCVRATSGRLLRCMHVSRSSSRAVGSSLKHRSALIS